MSKIAIPWLGQVSKGVLVSVMLSLLAVALFALFVKLFSPSDTVILVINQAVKLASILIGSFLAVGRGGAKGFIKGGLVGTGYMAVGMAAYTLVSQTGISPLPILAELGTGFGIGAITGAITANMAKK